MTYVHVLGQGVDDLLGGEVLIYPYLASMGLGDSGDFLGGFLCGLGLRSPCEWGECIPCCFAGWLDAHCWFGTPGKLKFELLGRKRDMESNSENNAKLSFGLVLSSTCHYPLDCFRP